MKKQADKMTDYLVVQVTDHINDKYIGYKLIPARWVEKPLRRITADQNRLIRYPEEETTETRLQVKNKEPFNPTWPTYSALIKFAGSYENACKVLDFVKEDDEIDLTTSAGEPPNNELNEAELSETPSTSFKQLSETPSTSFKQLSETPSTSFKRRLYSNKNVILPKKKRVSAIRSETNTKLLIESGQLLSNKQKVSPKKSLSLRKEDLNETLEKLINAEIYNKIDKLYSKDVTKEPHETLEIISSTDDSDYDSEPETLRPPEKSLLENHTQQPYPTNTTKKHNSTLKLGKSPERSKISSTKHLEQLEPTTNADGGQSSLHEEISNLAPKNSENATKNDAEDIKNLEDIYKSILSTKSDMTTVFVAKGEEFRKYFKYFNLVVPELKQGLSLPSIQQLRENSLVIQKEPQQSLRQEQPSHQKEEL